MPFLGFIAWRKGLETAFMRVKLVSSDGGTILQEQAAFDQETLRGFEEEDAEKSPKHLKSIKILRILTFPFLLLIVFLYLTFFPCTEE